MMDGKLPNRFGSIPKETHADARGWVINPFDHLAQPGGMSCCHAFSIEPGCSRGSHSHPARDEQVLVLHGEIVVRDMGTGREEKVSPSTGLLLIPPGVPHVFENRTAETVVALCFSSGAVDPSAPDTVREC